MLDVPAGTGAPEAVGFAAVWVGVTVDWAGAAVGVAGLTVGVGVCVAGGCVAGGVEAGVLLEGAPDPSTSGTRSASAAPDEQPASSRSDRGATAARARRETVMRPTVPASPTGAAHVRGRADPERMSLALNGLDVDQYEPRLVRATITAVSDEFATAHIRAHDYEAKGTLPISQWYAGRPLRVGDTHVFAQLSEDSHPLLSVTDKRVPGLVLESWIPELRTGDVRILRVSRIPGVRAKIAVAATREGVDPIEVTVGGRANNMKAYSRTLNGERAEMIAFHRDPHTFLRHAIGQTITGIDTDGERTTIWVPDHVYDAALGKHAVNALLSHRITQIKFRIRPDSERAQVAAPAA